MRYIVEVIVITLEFDSIELVKAYCLPLLLYAVESTAPANKFVCMMDRCVDVAVRKTFRLSNFENCVYIRSCVSLHRGD